MYCPNCNNKRLTVVYAKKVGKTIFMYWECDICKYRQGSQEGLE